MYAFEDQKGPKKKKTCFKVIDKGRRWKYINVRVQGLPFTSDGADD